MGAETKKEVVDWGRLADSAHGYVPSMWLCATFEPLVTALQEIEELSSMSAEAIIARDALDKLPKVQL